MVANVLVKRTSTNNSPPTGLVPGELACEMGTPLRLWIGVPTALDPSGKKLLAPLGGVTVADAPPANPAQGDLWWESDSGILWLWYDDGNSAQWVQAAGSGGSTLDAYTKAESDGRFVNVTGDTMTGDLTIDRAAVAGGNPTLTFNKTNTGTTQILGQQNGVNRWQIAITNAIPETGANVGSDFAIARYDDAGIMLGNGVPFQIERSSGNVAFQDNQVRFGNTTTVWYPWIMAWPANWIFSTDGNATTGQCMVPNGSAWVALSDARLPYKVSATPINNTLDRLAGVQLHHNVTPSGKDEVFFKAQELAVTLPELVIEGTGAQARDAGYVPTGMTDPNQWGIMYDRCGAVALQAIKELKAEVDALKAQLAAPKR